MKLRKINWQNPEYGLKLEMTISQTKNNSIQKQLFDMFNFDGDNKINEVEYNSYISNCGDVPLTKENALKYLNEANTKSAARTKEYLSDVLFMDLYSDANYCFYPMKKDFAEHLQNLNEDNVLDVLYKYNNGGENLNNCKNIFLDILNSDIIKSNDEKISYINTIIDLIVKAQGKKGCYIDDIAQKLKNVVANDVKNELNIRNLTKELFEVQQDKPNGRIDKPFYQGDEYDCDLIATLSALSRKPKGREYLSKMIKLNEDGSVTVKFKGLDEEITVTPEQIKNDSFAKGDPDVAAIEAALSQIWFLTGVNAQTVLLKILNLIENGKRKVLFRKYLLFTHLILPLIS